MKEKPWKAEIFFSLPKQVQKLLLTDVQIIFVKGWMRVLDAPGHPLLLSCHLRLFSDYKVLSCLNTATNNKTVLHSTDHDLAINVD